MSAHHVSCFCPTCTGRRAARLGLAAPPVKVSCSSCSAHVSGPVEAQVYRFDICRGCHEKHMAAAMGGLWAERARQVEGEERRQREEQGAREAAERERREREQAKAADELAEIRKQRERSRVEARMRWWA